MAIDPITGQAILSGVGAVFSAIGGRGAAREERRQRQALEAENARQMAIRRRIGGLIEPSLRADISGVESPGIRLARQREEALARQTLSREGAVERQAIIDRLARTGGATGRQAVDITAPAAQARLSEFERGQAERLRELSIRLAARNAERREAARRAAVPGLLSLGQFESQGFIPVPPRTSFSELGQVGAELLGQGLSGLLSRSPVRCRWCFAQHRGKISFPFVHRH